MDHNPSERILDQWYSSVIDPPDRNDVRRLIVKIEAAARQPLLDAVDAAICGWEYPADGPRNYSETISSALAPYRNQGDPDD